MESSRDLLFTYFAAHLGVWCRASCVIVMVADHACIKLSSCDSGCTTVVLLRAAAVLPVVGTGPPMPGTALLDFVGNRVEVADHTPKVMCMLYTLYV